MTHKCYRCGNLFASDNLRFISLFSSHGVCKPCDLKCKDTKLYQLQTSSLLRMCDMSPEYRRYCDTIERAVPGYSQVEYRNGGLVYSNVAGDAIVMGEEPKKCTCCD